MTKYVCLAVIAIISIITSVVLARYRSFDSSILLRNLAYEIALSAREAQVLGISVHGEAGVFTDAYGMHFTTGTTYTLFRDDNGNNQYDGSGEAVSFYTIGQQNQIVGLSANGTTVNVIDVVFRRPDPDALLYTQGVANPSSAVIVVGAPDGSTRLVRIWPTGQIAVDP